MCLCFFLEIEFFCMETGYLVSHRLKKLCESHCEDLALNLVTAFMCCYRMAETQQFNLNATEEQRWFIFDVYIALLFKFKKTSLILTTVRFLLFVVMKRLFTIKFAFAITLTDKTSGHLNFFKF